MERAVITGGAGGIGRAVAARFLARGMRVAVWDRAGAEAVPGCEMIAVDVTDPGSVAQAADATEALLGGIEVLVTSVGITGPTAPVEDYPWDAWRRVLAVNLDGVFLASRAVIPVMRRAPQGRIVHISSIGGKEGNAGQGAYAAAKAGVIGLTKSMGKELAQTGIRVNCVAPAMIESPLLDSLSPEFIAAMTARIPMNRLGRAEEVAALVDWLASAECSFSTGACFDASGGRASF